MSLRAVVGGVRRQALGSLYRRIVAFGERGPIVSFAFDDFPRTAYTVGGHILKSVGARGTYYAAMGLMGTSNDLGEQFRADDLTSLLAEGHELATHTFSHISSRSVPLSAFVQDVQRGYQAIRQITGVAPSHNFAYPYGEVTARAKKALGSHMSSCRGTYRGLNGPEVDLNLLQANSLYGTASRLVQMGELISANVERKGWLIFYTHDIRDNPSRYGCTPGLFEATVSMAIRSGSKILSVVDVVSDLSREVCIAKALFSDRKPEE